MSGIFLISVKGNVSSFPKSMYSTTTVSSWFTSKSNKELIVVLLPRVKSLSESSTLMMGYSLKSLLSTKSVMLSKSMKSELNSEDGDYIKR